MPIGLFVDMSGKSCVICGGGEVAERKAGALLAGSAVVKVVAPEISRRIRSWADQNALEWIEAQAADQHLRGAFLVVCATGNEQVDRSLVRRARAEGILACSASRPEEGDVHFGACLQRGPIAIAISTAGTSPALSRLLKEEIDARWPEELVLAARWLKDARRIAIEKVEEDAVRRALLREAAETVCGIVRGRPLDEVKQNLRALFDARGLRVPGLEDDAP